MNEPRSSRPLPLQSVAFELRFPGSPRVEVARADFFEILCDRFPVMRVPYLQEGAAPALQPYRFTDDAGAKWVNIAVNLFNFGCLGPLYTSFEELMAEFLHLLDDFVSVYPNVETTGLTRIGLRYINHLPVVRGADGQISDVPLVMPMSTAADGPVQNILNVFEQQLSGGVLRAIIDTTQEDLVPDQALLDFDFLYNASPDARIKFSQVEECLVEAHAVIKRALVQTVRGEYATEVGIA